MAMQLLKTFFSRKVSGKQSGFTLIELMITVVIVGILAAVAYPSYQNQVRKTKRSDAKTALTELANRQEKYYSQCNTYASTIGGTFPTSGGTACTSGTPGLGVSTSSPDGNYTLSIPSASTSAYTVQAAAKSTSTQNNDTGCTTLAITSTGVKTPATGGCW